MSPPKIGPPSEDITLRVCLPLPSTRRGSILSLTPLGAFVRSSSIYVEHPSKWCRKARGLMLCPTGGGRGTGCCADGLLAARESQMMTILLP